MKILHIYTDASGASQVAEVEPTLNPDVVGRRTPWYPSRGGYLKTFPAGRKSGAHNAPRRQFVIHLYGAMVISTPSGFRRELQPGDVVFAEDTTGSGHFSDGGDNERGCFYAPVDPDFDFHAWCQGREVGQ